jgi:alkylated DNA repair dioxygenase AlkB
MTAQVVDLTPDGASWLLYVPKWLPSTPEKLAEVNSDKPTERHKIKLFGHEVAIPRFQQAYGLSYQFSGAVSESKPFTEPIEELRKRVVGELRKHPLTSQGNLDFNMCLVNWYDTGEHYISPHSDDEKQFVSGTVIAGLSWGASRQFVLTPKRAEYAKHTFQMNDGDLIVMGGTTQKTHKHGIPKSRCQDQRVSFTFRVFQAPKKPAPKPAPALDQSEEIVD